MIELPRISRALENVLVGCGVLLLFTPKINLLAISGQSAGIRVDDIALAGLCLLIAVCFLYSCRFSISRLEVVFASFFFISLCSNALNIFAYGRSNLLYSFRLIEYFIFLYVGCYYSERHSIRPLTWAILFLNGAVMVLQRVGLVGAATSEGLIADSTRRAVGLTGGPWEVGILLNFCFAVLVFDEERKRNLRFALILFIGILGLLLLTGARMPSLTHMVLLIVYLYRRSTKKRVFVLQAISILFLASAMFVLIPNPVVERSSKLLTKQNFEVLVDAYKHIDVGNTFEFGDPFENSESMTSDDTDFSWISRTLKWAAASKMYLSDSRLYLVGIGPGTTGIALDGGWLRIITETGIAGFVFFLILFNKIRRLSAEMSGVVLSLFISMIMIDIHMAYKAMAFTYFAAGYYCNHRVRVSLPPEVSS